MKTLLNSKQQEFWDAWTKWLKDDIETSFNNNANLAVMALICCGIDAFAGYYYGVDIEQDRNFKYKSKPYGAGKRFSKFVEKYLHDFVKEARHKSGQYKSKRICINREKDKYDFRKYSDIFYKQFRCGQVHEGIIKQGAIIEKWGASGKYFDSSKRGYLILNIDRLWPDFANAVDEFKHGVENKRERARLFCKRYDFLRPYG